jgi:hypothetical protein
VVLRWAGAAASVRPSAEAVREVQRWVAAGPSAQQAAALPPGEPVARDVASVLPPAARDAAEGPRRAEVLGVAAEPRQAAEGAAWVGAAARRPEEAAPAGAEEALRREAGEARDAAAAARQPAEVRGVAAQRRAVPSVLPSGLPSASAVPRERHRQAAARPAPQAAALVARATAQQLIAPRSARSSQAARDEVLS